MQNPSFKSSLNRAMRSRWKEVCMYVCVYIYFYIYEREKIERFVCIGMKEMKEEKKKHIG